MDFNDGGIQKGATFIGKMGMRSWLLGFGVRAREASRDVEAAVREGVGFSTP